jgi:type II secretory pathway pseudopilin PulG
MMQFSRKITSKQRRKGAGGFTLVEVILAGAIMIILCVGTLTVFTHAIKINSGNNLRAQALSVLQLEIEYYRSLKYVPVGSNSALNGGIYNNVRTRTSADGQTFSISVTIDNDPFTAGIQTSTTVPEANCKFKEITINAVPTVAQTGWLANLKTNVTIQRVRAN